MSLLADLLSKVKADNKGSREVPPDLKKVVYSAAGRERTTKRMLLLSMFVVIAIAAGFFSVLFLERYLFKQPQQIVIHRPAPAPAAEQIQQQPAQIQTDTLNNPKEPEPLKEKNTPELNNKPASAKEETSGHSPKNIQRAEPAKATTKKEQPTTQPVTAETAQTSLEKPALPSKKQASYSEEKLTASSPAQKSSSAINTAPSPRPQLQASSSYNTNSDIYLYTAKNHEARREYKQAFENYIKALELSPNNYIIMNNISGVLLQTGAYAESVKYAKDSLCIKKDYIPSLINLGLANIKSGNESEGEGYITKAASIDPSNSYALFNLAILQEKRKEYDKSYGTFYRLASLGNAQGWTGMARILEKQGRLKEAAAIYREILSMDKMGSEEKKIANERLKLLE